MSSEAKVHRNLFVTSRQDRFFSIVAKRCQLTWSEMVRRVLDDYIDLDPERVLELGLEEPAGEVVLDGIRSEMGGKRL